MIARVRRSEFARHGAIVFGGVAVAAVCNYLYYVLIGRRVGVEGYGIVTALASTLLVLSLIHICSIAARGTSSRAASSARFAPA